MADEIRIATGALSATLSTLGAELVALHDGQGRALLWNGDPAFWTGRAPLLFPIVGRVAGDAVTVGGRRCPMRQHGLARISTFRIVEANATSARLRLEADAGTREHYPFEFRLDVVYVLDGASLAIRAEVGNPGSVALPAAFGFHPGFLWPLPYGAPRAAHVIDFEAPEPEPIRRLEGGLVLPQTVPSPLEGRRLVLRDEIFAHDALIFDAVRSRSVFYHDGQGHGLRVRFPHMPQLGIWTKPGAPFVCIEPWSGYASPQGFEGELADKPGMTLIPPGASRSFGMAVTLEGIA